MDAYYEDDFWNGTSEVGKLGSDGDKTDSPNVEWWGHCDHRAAVIMLHDAPTGDYYAPNSIVFTPSLKKGLLVALYHGFGIAEGSSHYDISPHEWHAMLEQYIIADDRMFACDIHNSVSGPDTISNVPVYRLEEAEYEERDGYGEEIAVTVACKAKCWGTGGEYMLYYKYNVTYNTMGTAQWSGSPAWLEHPDTPIDYPEYNEAPDFIWYPETQTSIDSFWNGQLDYDTIASIIPLN